MSDAAEWTLAMQTELEAARALILRQSEAQQHWMKQARDAQAEVERLRAAMRLAVDFHGADTQAFVARYGHGMTTRELCDRLRWALDSEKAN